MDENPEPEKEEDETDQLIEIARRSVGKLYTETLGEKDKQHIVRSLTVMKSLLKFPFENFTEEGKETGETLYDSASKVYIQEAAHCLWSIVLSPRTQTECVGMTLAMCLSLVIYGMKLERMKASVKNQIRSDN